MDGSDYMTIVAHLEDGSEAGARPRDPRRKLRFAARGDLPSGAFAEILVHNISATGLLLETEASLLVDERITIELPQAGATQARVVWTSGSFFGCQFHTPITAAALSAAQLRAVAGDSAQPTPGGRPDTDVSFGARLQRLRKLRGISQSHVASQLGVSKPTVWAWEHDKARPIDARIADLAEVLGVTSAELISGDGAPIADDIVSRSRERIASAYGTSPDKVEIWVKL